MSSLSDSGRAASGVDELYRATVLEHYRHPRNRKPLADPDGSALVHNPVCGDQVRVEIRRAGGALERVAAITRGCSIAVASGSLMTEWAPGRTPAEVHALRCALGDLVEGRADPESVPEVFRAFVRVAELPSRRRCALLAWEALEAALAGDANASQP